MRRVFLCLTCVSMAAQFSYAETISFTGTFTSDTDTQTFSVVVLNPTAGVTFRTFGYAGGTNGAGQLIPQGGFEPVLGVFLADGTAMNPGPSGPCGGVLPADSVSGACGDVYYPTTVPFPGGIWQPGTYLVTLSVFANAPVGNLSDGFFANAVLGLTNPSNFTCIAGAPGYQGTPPTIGEGEPFCDQNLANTQRTGSWALDFINVDSAEALGSQVVPEPASVGLMSLGVALLTVAKFRRRI
jgi:hypothetical protein